MLAAQRYVLIILSGMFIIFGSFYLFRPDVSVMYEKIGHEKHQYGPLLASPPRYFFA